MKKKEEKTMETEVKSINRIHIFMTAQFLDWYWHVNKKGGGINLAL